MNDYGLPSAECCGTPKNKIMQVPASIDRLNKASEQLKVLVVELIDRISPISRHEPIGEGKDQSANASAPVPIVGQIDTITNKLNGMAGMINGAIDRIEV